MKCLQREVVTSSASDVHLIERCVQQKCDFYSRSLEPTTAMPTLFKMSDEKQTINSPTVVVAETPSVQPRKTKKYLIIAGSIILSAAIILIAILVGMYMFTQAQKEIIQYTLKLSENSKQDVTSDPNENVVQYHVSSPGRETWTVNDFNKDIQVVKIQTEKTTTCYINALDRSTATDPSKVTEPQSADIKDSSSLIYMTSNTPISDTSFLSKTASDVCKGISVYWVYPHCLDKNNANSNNTDMIPKPKRRDADFSPYFYVSYWNEYACVAGCCKYVCGSKIDFHHVVYTNYMIFCIWYLYDSNNNPTSYIPGYGCYPGPTGLSCPNQYPATWGIC